MKKKWNESKNINWKFKGHVIFDDVRFGYSSDKTIIHDQPKLQTQRPLLVRQVQVRRPYNLDGHISAKPITMVWYWRYDYKKSVFDTGDTRFEGTIEKPTNQTISPAVEDRWAVGSDLFDLAEWQTPRWSATLSTSKATWFIACLWRMPAHLTKQLTPRMASDPGAMTT